MKLKDGGHKGQRRGEHTFFSTVPALTLAKGLLFLKENVIMPGVGLRYSDKLLDENLMHALLPSSGMKRAKSRCLAPFPEAKSGGKLVRNPVFVVPLFIVLFVVLVYTLGYHFWQ
jgi:hypothetical protein